MQWHRHHAIPSPIWAPKAHSASRYFITDDGLISGTEAAPSGAVHANLWYKELTGYIGALGGPNSVAFGVNGTGQAVGLAQTSTADPNGEDFCGFKALGLPSKGTTCLPFLWQNTR